MKKTRPKAIKLFRDICVGDKFYYNNYSTKRGDCLPDYLVITQIKEVKGKRFIVAKYENHYVYTHTRMFSDSILDDSNLNPLAANPKWVFLAN